MTKTILITGATSGFGRAAAIRFARAYEIRGDGDPALLFRAIGPERRVHAEGDESAAWRQVGEIGESAGLG